MKKFLRVSLYIIANACIILSALYITFTILDGFNPMFHFIKGNILTMHLHIILPALSFAFGVFFLIYYWMCKKPKQQSSPRRF
ncbi:MAG: hypothetical protein FWF10_06980 [Clostridiales bacterium]|nr:hypothetical protein [Clostridiales bacterium]